jgi:hypothetical protein
MHLMLSAVQRFSQMGMLFFKNIIAAMTVRLRLPSGPKRLCTSLAGGLTGRDIKSADLLMMTPAAMTADGPWMAVGLDHAYEQTSITDR